MGTIQISLATGKSRKSKIYPEGVLGFDSSAGHEGEATMQLEVKKAYPNDVGRGIIRLDPSTILGLDVGPGDTVEVIGESRTCAKVWRADRQEWGESQARIDGFVRQNAGVEVGDEIDVDSVDAPDASKIVLTDEDGQLSMETGIEQTIKKELLKRPISSGDIIPVGSLSSSPVHGVTDRTVLLKSSVVRHDGHSGIAVITKDTHIELDISEPEPRAVTSQPEDGCIDIPHEPDAEAALIQETRERLAMLETHTADPEAVMALQQANEDLEAIMANVASTEEYKCSQDSHYFD